MDTPDTRDLNGLPRRSGSTLRPVVPLLFALLFQACGILDEGAPETARIVIQGPAGHPLSLVTSSDFDAITSADGDSREVTVFSADTAVVTIPYDREHPLGPRTRIYVVVGSDSTATSSVRVQVFIDGGIRFDRSSRFDDGEEMEFVFASASN